MVYNNSRKLREAVGVFDDVDSLEEAIFDLQSHGFNRADLSVLADEKTIARKTGHLYDRVEDIEDDEEMPRKVFISNDSLYTLEGATISMSMLVAAIIAAGVAMSNQAELTVILAASAISASIGGIIGGFLAHIIRKKHLDYIKEQLQHGGMVLWVRTCDKPHEQQAEKILKNHHAHDVHIHEYSDEDMALAA